MEDALSLDITISVVRILRNISLFSCLLFFSFFLYVTRPSGNGTLVEVWGKEALDGARDGAKSQIS